MNKIIKELKEAFAEFETNVLPIGDFDIHFRGTLITHICLNGNNISLWSGDMDEDENAEELLPNDEDKLAILKEINSYL